MKASCEASLKRLGTDFIDLYILARTDENVPIEATVSDTFRPYDLGQVGGDVTPSSRLD